MDAGAAEIDLDLRNLDLQRLEIKAGAADIDVVMPAAAGKTEASIEVGAASLRITVPEGVAARIVVDAGLSSIQVDEGRFAQLQGDVYTSPDFERAANRLDITIDAGASHVEIRHRLRATGSPTGASGPSLEPACWRPGCGRPARRRRWPSP